MSSPPDPDRDLTPFSYAVLALVGEGGSGPHDIVLMMRRGSTYWAAAESHWYAEPKRLAKLGYLAAERTPGRTRARTHYRLTPQGRDAVRAWFARPTGFPRIQDEAALRMLAASLAGDDAALVASLAAGREELEALDALLDENMAALAGLPHRARYLGLLHGLGRATVRMRREWIAQVEAALGGGAVRAPGAARAPEAGAVRTPVLVIAATERELEGAPAWAARLACGIGPVDAAAATAHALAASRPAAVLHVGIAGARRAQGLPLRSLVLGTAATYEDAAGFHLVVHRLEPDTALLEAAARALPEAALLPIGTSARVGGGGAEAPLEAMEGFAVVRACTLAGVPALELRCVSNEVEEHDRARWDFAGALAALAGAVPHAARAVAAAVAGVAGAARPLP